MKAPWLLLVAASLKITVSAQCSNTDYQVVVNRYTDTQCTDDETISYYQSGGVIRESTSQYKTFTCCDDLGSVAIHEDDTDVSPPTTLSRTDDTNKCYTGTVSDTGSSGTTDYQSYQFQCVANPTTAAITITVYDEGAPNCSSSQTPDIRLPSYEGCNEDFPVILDLECDGADIVVAYSENKIEECSLLAYDQNPDTFTLSQGCNIPAEGETYMGFSSPIEVYSTCGAGLSGGAVAAVVIIVILVLAGAGFAYWWLKVRPKQNSASVDFTEYNEYSQLDGDVADTDLL
jgi:hypothetical protein